ncbi:MAG: hypothetical protein L6306_15135 [Planctomycetales bacterium]|nr:hypothetical protein [Planctomycetales bacterium]
MPRARGHRLVAFFLIFAGAYFLPMIRPAVGQETDWGLEQDWDSPEEWALAQRDEGSAAPPARRDRQPTLSSQAGSSQRSAARTPIVRLASVPNIFGDSFSRGGGLGYYDGEQPGQYTVIDLPPAGGGGRMRIADNNKAFPTDRVFFMYNHFQNALLANPITFGPGETASLDRYTFGLEKTFRDGLWSVELRMPFCGAYQISAPGATVGSEHIGNLKITLKRLLYTAEYSAVAAGLGIETPTGSDTTGAVYETDFTVHNDAAYLSPWIGILGAPNSKYFYQGFLQLDLAANGNAVDLDSTRLGRYCEQNLMYVDLALGRWLFHEPAATGLKGMAMLVEFHYATTLQDSMMLTGEGRSGPVIFGNLDNRLDVPNITVGLHTEIAKTTVEIGGVLPLRTGRERMFDAEVQIFVNRYF